MKKLLFPFVLLLFAVAGTDTRPRQVQFRTEDFGCR